MRYSEISSPKHCWKTWKHHFDKSKPPFTRREILLKGTPHIARVNKSAGSREREVASILTAPVMSNDYVAVLQPASPECCLTTLLVHYTCASHRCKLARGVPIFHEEVPKILTFWGWGVPIITGSPKFYDTGTVLYLTVPATISNWFLYLLPQVKGQIST